MRLDQLHNKLNDPKVQEEIKKGITHFQDNLEELNGIQYDLEIAKERVSKEKIDRILMEFINTSMQLKAYAESLPLPKYSKQQLNQTYIAIDNTVIKTRSNLDKYPLREGYYYPI